MSDDGTIESERTIECEILSGLTLVFSEVPPSEALCYTPCPDGSYVYLVGSTTGLLSSI